MTKKKDSSGDFGFGEILLPFLELANILVLKLMQLMTELILYLWKRYTDPSPPVKKIERKALSNKSTTLQDDAIGYSITNRKQILGSEIDKSTHCAVVGASGSGKTALLDALMFEDMQKGRPVIYIDPKGDRGSMENFIRLCQITGRDFAVFSEKYQSTGSCALNPVKDGSASNIADRIHHAFTWTEEHYSQICRDALETAIINLRKNEALITLESVYKEIVYISDPNRKDKLFLREDVQGILSRLQKLTKSDFGEKLGGKKALSFKEIRDSKKCVYIGLSVLGYAEIARALGRMILGDISYCAYDTYCRIDPTRHKRTSMGIYIDELSAVITDEFIEILNKARGAGMELTFAFQSPSDIAKKDKNLCVQILENASTWFILKQRVEEGAKIFAQAIGTLEAKKQTLRIEDGEEQSLGSQRAVEEFIVHPNILKNLNVGQCILLRHFPTRIDLLNIKYIDPKIVRSNLEFLSDYKINDMYL